MMPKRSSFKSLNRNADVFQWASALVRAVTEEKNPAAVALGRIGGKKGGPARAAKLTAKRRSEIAKKAAEARWNNQ